MPNSMPDTMIKSAELSTGNFDEEFDVVVVGFGFAGGISAIEAHDHGASVLLLEKMEDPGGLSICSGGAVRCASDFEAAFEYLKQTNAGTTPDDVLAVLARGMTEAEEYVRQLVDPIDEIELKPVGESGKRGGNYPFIGWETFYHTQVQFKDKAERSTLFPGLRNRPSSGGPEMFWLIREHVQRRNIEFRLNTPAIRLIKRNDNSVCGLVVWDGSRLRRIAARSGVILACGGFEFNHDMKAQYWEGKPVLSASGRGNTGDGIKMAQSMGAELWHMWHFHGCYAFKHPDPCFPYALRVKRLPDWNPAEKDNADVPMVWIVLDQNGKRYMNECPPYAQDTGHRSMHHFEAEQMLYPRNPSWLITDWKGCQTYQLGDTRTNDRAFGYDWSSDNMKEVELGILQTADTVTELSLKTSIPEKTLSDTLTRWNELCSERRDDDYGRPGGTMTPIRTAPYVFGKVYPTVSNTQGGPVHNGKQEILDTDGQAIPGLYSAGELGSSFGHLYLSGGNIAECFVTGRVAGREAADRRSR